MGILSLFWGPLILAFISTVMGQSFDTAHGDTSLTGWHDPTLYNSYESHQVAAAAVPRQDVAGLLGNPLVQLAAVVIGVGAASLAVQGQIVAARNKADNNENNINIINTKIEQLTSQVATSREARTTDALLTQQRSLMETCGKVNEIVGITPIDSATNGIDSVQGGINPQQKAAIKNIENKVNEIVGVSSLTC